MNCLSLTSQEFSENIFQQLGKGRDHAEVIYKEWFRNGAISLNHPIFSNCPQLLKNIVSRMMFKLPEIRRRIQAGSTEKFLLNLQADQWVESVVIPMKFGKTLCVSSQVGCRMGCTFCQTGRMGLIRQLTVEEIVAQLFIAKHILGHDIRNIVFMGMGEPFDNFDAVHQAIKIFTDPLAFALGKSHITVSTVGRVDGIERMRLEMDPAINLAISVNAPNESVRKQIMPITRKYSMIALKEALIKYTADPRRKLLIEYVLIKNLNDSLQAADELAAYLEGLSATVNLIPYNPQHTDPFEKPSQKILEQFQAQMQSHGRLTFLRITKGDDIMAACGQLGSLETKSLKKATTL